MAAVVILSTTQREVFSPEFISKNHPTDKKSFKVKSFSIYELSFNIRLLPTGHVGSK